MDYNHDRQVAVLKALADATRLRILRLLYREELNVQELADILQIGQPRVSRHLAVLRNATLVEGRREGTKAYYTLVPSAPIPPAIEAYIESLGSSEHPDLERLGECLRSRAQHAQSFADDKAEVWDEIKTLLHSSSASMLALTRLVPQRLTLADLGTGTGLMLPFLSSLASHVFAIDQSARMLDRARERCRQLGINNVTFMQSAIEELDYQLPTCDGLLLHFVLHQVPRPLPLLKHIAQFVRPEGRLVIVDRKKHEDERAKTTFGSLWLGFTRDQIDKWLTEAGLCDVNWLSPTVTERGPESEQLVFVASAAKAATPT